MLASLYEHRTKPKVVEKAPKQPLNSFTRKSNEIPNTVCNASLKDKIYTLTSKTNQKGAMWVPCESDGVLVSFKISNAVSNGDGFAVVMQTDGPSAIGGNRYNKGFGGIKEGIAQYLENQKVPLSSHVKNSIILNDEVKQTYWDHVQHEIKVLFNEQRLTCWVDDVEQITCVLPSATWKSIVNKQKFIGVTCSTGVKYTICKIYDFSVYYLDCPETKARVHFTTKSKQQIHLVGDAKYKRDCISIIDGANSVGAMWTKIAGRKIS
ncbi:TLDc domain-containing protein [Entamoeba marina]